MSFCTIRRTPLDATGAPDPVELDALLLELICPAERMGDAATWAYRVRQMASAYPGPDFDSGHDDDVRIMHREALAALVGQVHDHLVVCDGEAFWRRRRDLVESAGELVGWAAVLAPVASRTDYAEALIDLIYSDRL